MLSSYEKKVFIFYIAELYLQEKKKEREQERRGQRKTEKLIVKYLPQHGIENSRSNVVSIASYRTHREDQKSPVATQPYF